MIVAYDRFMGTFLLRVPLGDAEYQKLKKQADKLNISVPELARQKLGAKPRERGGARKGAGRPKKEPNSAA